ncbi:uncharacterized protein K02A2.6-like, partial [Lampris incognitus]|uniref:uncharacterized protein K02A2.6-like n=1 Tax=Lampris incognitus TaxID=2546036 RepID=UPI0024B4E023
NIKVKPDTKPVFRKARPVPYALKDAVEKELDRLEKAGIISKVDHSQWAAPIVVVPKSDKSTRICGDYKFTVNQSVEEETYPLPNAEDLFATLAGGTLFSKLDLSHAYQQLELEKDSEKYLTINTHKGLYVYHRLSYGVSSAPSMFQNVMDQILQGLEHVTCFLDDILVTGRTREEHLRNLDEVLSRLESYGVRVKRAKCDFMQEKVEYLGHLIDKEGLHPTETKVAAIVNAPQPTNVTELRSFLGLLNYYGRFMKDLSHVLPDRKTFAKDLDKAYAAMEKQLKNKLDAQDYVSATADIWSSNNESFLGVTVHWIDEGKGQAAITQSNISQSAIRPASPRDELIIGSYVIGPIIQRMKSDEKYEELICSNTSDPECVCKLRHLPPLLSVEVRFLEVAWRGKESADLLSEEHGWCQQESVNSGFSEHMTLMLDSIMVVFHKQFCDMAADWKNHREFLFEVQSSKLKPASYPEKASIVQVLS